ncbi:hypothetical protein MKX01_039706 [Papaver californicum]|nr:hypothetical protein MKX01_039706 [Papaver californicum]
MNDPFDTYIPHRGGPYLNHPHRQYMTLLMYHTRVVTRYIPVLLCLALTILDKKMITQQEFGSTATTPISFSELLESNLSPWELGY